MSNTQPKCELLWCVGDGSDDEMSLDDDDADEFYDRTAAASASANWRMRKLKGGKGGAQGEQ
jgi:hypothetical protein